MSRPATHRRGPKPPRAWPLALPELLRRLSAALLLMKTLLYGQRTDTDPKFHWADLNAAFAEATKRRKPAAQRRPATSGPRVVRTLLLTTHTDEPQQLSKKSYGPTHTLTVENRAATPLLLWMAQNDGAKTTPLPCPAGAITVLTRADLGPETAKYLMAQFEGQDGGQATLVVRRLGA